MKEEVLSLCSTVRGGGGDGEGTRSMAYPDANIMRSTGGKSSTTWKRSSADAEQGVHVAGVN